MEFSPALIDAGGSEELERVNREITMNLPVRKKKKFRTLFEAHEYHRCLKTLPTDLGKG